MSLVDGLLALRYQPNPDVAFSLLSRFGIERNAAALLAIAIVATVGVTAGWIASRKRATAIHHLGFALVVAGALGNLVDRATRGYVVDFIHVTHWPVFNVADIAVVFGALLLAVAAWKHPQPASAA